MDSESSATGLFGVLRLLRPFRKATKAAGRPTISVELARQRYEPLVESLADALGDELGVEWRPQAVRQRRRTYETRRWITDLSLVQFPDWTAQVDATVRQVVDVVDLPTLDFGEGSPSTPPELERRLSTATLASPSSGPGGVDDEGTGFSIVRRVRDRVGADVVIVVENDRTTLSAIAPVNKP